MSLLGLSLNISYVVPYVFYTHYTNIWRRLEIIRHYPGSDPLIKPN